MNKPKLMPSYWSLVDEVTQLCGQLDKLEAENAKLRELAENLLMGLVYLETPEEQQKCIDRAIDLRRELDVLPMEYFDASELGIDASQLEID